MLACMEARSNAIASPFFFFLAVSKLQSRNKNITLDEGDFSHKNTCFSRTSRRVNFAGGWLPRVAFRSRSIGFGGSEKVFSAVAAVSEQGVGPGGAAGGLVF